MCATPSWDHNGPNSQRGWDLICILLWSQSFPVSNPVISENLPGLVKIHPNIHKPNTCRNTSNTSTGVYRSSTSYKLISLCPTIKNKKKPLEFCNTMISASHTLMNQNQGLFSRYQMTFLKKKKKKPMMVPIGLQLIIIITFSWFLI